MRATSSSHQALLALVALTSALAGCSREQPAPPAPGMAPAAAAAAAPAPAAAGPAARTKAQAMTALMALPELKAWSSRIEAASGGAARGALIEYDAAPRIIDGQRYWQFSFVENGSAAAHRWESFLVAEHGGAILVEDFATDQAITLEQWRTDKHPLERTSAL